MHALIVGEQGVGKSTLIARVRQGLSRTEAGLETVREAALAGDRGAPVYIYRVGEPRSRSDRNLAAYVRQGGREVFPRVFDRFAGFLEEDAPKGSLIVLDELGFLESASPRFCDAVLRVLDGPVPVIAAVKPADTPFLRAVRGHRNGRVFRIDRENRDALAETVLAFLREQ